MSQNPTNAPSPSVEVINGKPVVSSLKVAEHFGKQHKHILRLIDQKIAASDERGQPKIGPSQKRHADFFAANFFPATYLNEQNKTQPMFYMTRDGFSYLVMGFTGDKADEFKILYINAFNAMEAELVKSLPQKDQDSIRDVAPEFRIRIKQGFTSISADERRGLQGLINLWAEVEGISTKEAQERALANLDVPSWDYVQPQEIDLFAWNIERMMFRASKDVCVGETDPIDLAIINGLLDFGAFVRGFKRKALEGCLCAMCGIPDLEHLSPRGAIKAKMVLWSLLADIKMG